MNRFFKHFSVAFVTLLSISVMTGCSDEDEPCPGKDPTQTGQVQFADDLLNGGLVYLAQYDGEGFDVPIKTNKPVRFKVCNETPFSIETVYDCQENHIKGHHKGEFKEKAGVIVMRAENRMNPKDYRHFLVIVANKDAAPEEASKASNSSHMAMAYGDFIGMGTQCFMMLGNTKQAVLKSSAIPFDNQTLVTSQVLNHATMFERSGESFRSEMTSWSANIGISFKGLNIVHKPGDKMSGCFDFGIHESVNTSEDFEYYINVYRVVRGEIAFNMGAFELMTTKAETATTFLSYVSPTFINDILMIENKNLDTNKFFETWGTDMISQAQLGGFKIYMYGRETNIYESRVEIDAALDLKGTRPAETDGSKGWYDIYKMKQSPYIGGEVGASYMNEDYFQSSRRQRYSTVVGGNVNFNEEPDNWMKGFEEMDDNVKWQPISYRRNSDSNEDTWCLYPIDKMGTNVIAAVETLFKGLELSDNDKRIIENAHSNEAAINEARLKYIDDHLITPKEASPLVLCDVMMKYERDKQLPGKPEPFVAKDPRDSKKLRTYYPMMANKFFDYRRSSEHQRGRAIDTNVDCFKVAAEAGSHYWYYTLAHSDDCQGIVDITFYDHLEDNFVYRGDEASKGSGLANYPKRVCVKYFDSDYKESDKITAFGIYDDHKEVNNIIASTGGSELALEATKSEYNEWVDFWKDAKDHHNWPKYAFYHGGGSIPHGIYVKYTTKPLPISNIKEVKHPNKY